MNRESEGKSIGSPHLAKNERDMGYPAFVTGLGRSSPGFPVEFGALG
jgi:hypothetical protein